MYEFCVDLWNGDWWLDENNMLYIIPQLESNLDEVYGGDGYMLEMMQAIRNVYNIMPDEKELEQYGLKRVPESLKRFSDDDGYYTA